MTFHFPSPTHATPLRYSAGSVAPSHARRRRVLLLLRRRVLFVEELPSFLPSFLELRRTIVDMQWLFSLGSSAPSTPPPSCGTSSHKLLEAHALARDCLSLALQADESGDSSLAVKRYLQCLSACSLGLSPPGAPSSRPTVGAADAAVLDELAKWQASVADRIAMLKTQTQRTQQQHHMLSLVASLSLRPGPPRLAPSRAIQS